MFLLFFHASHFSPGIQSLSYAGNNHAVTLKKLYSIRVRRSSSVKPLDILFFFSAQPGKSEKSSKILVSKDSRYWRSAVDFPLKLVIVSKIDNRYGEGLSHSSKPTLVVFSTAFPFAFGASSSVPSLKSNPETYLKCF